MIATNNGSYPWRGTSRGSELEAAKERRRRGEMPAEELRALQDQATREAIEEQARAGLDLVTDGLVRFDDPVGPIVTRLAGMRAGQARASFPGRGAEIPVPVAESEVSWKEPILVEDYLFARQGSPKPVKVVLPGPFTIAGITEDRAYGDPSSLATALAFALNQELRALQTAGATFVQVDEPGILAHREDFPIFTRVWEVLGRGVQITLCLHLEGGGIDGLYPGIARLKRLGCLSLDGVAGRASLRLLRDSAWPETLRLGLGLIDGRSETIESPSDIVAAVRDLSGLPPHDRILLGTASDLGGLQNAVAAAKLRSLAQAARSLSV